MKEGQPAAVLYFDTIDSTNNYASAMCAAGSAQHGTTVVAAQQTSGRGQRSRVWQSEPGKNLLMSVVITPNARVEEFPRFNMAVAFSVYSALAELTEIAALKLKWPNDLMIRDRKAGGILIENTFHGSSWVASIIGIGINVLQDRFSVELPSATSLLLEGAGSIRPEHLVEPLREAVMSAGGRSLYDDTVVRDYNEVLYKNGSLVHFNEGGLSWQGRIEGVEDTGFLCVKTEAGDIRKLRHGDATWIL